MKKNSNKTSPEQLKAVRVYREKKKKEGYVFYHKLIKKEWVQALNAYLEVLKKQENMVNKS